MLNRTAKSWLNRAYGFGLLLYPLAAHLSVYYQEPETVIGYVALIVAISALININRPVLVTGLAAISLSLVGLLAISKSQLLQIWIYIPPALIPLWLSVIFIQSLKKPDGAIITRIAEMIERGKLDPGRLKYTRIVTGIWGLLLLLMAIEAIVLAWLAPMNIWSWWVHIGNYSLLFVLFALEILTRWLLFRRSPELGQMIKVMMKRPWQMSDRA